MRAHVPVVFTAFGLFTGCSDGSSPTDNGGGAGGTATITSPGGGGSGGTTSTTTDTSTTGMASTGCETAGSAPLSFGIDVQPIFSESCGSASTCHLKASPSEGLSLEVGQAYAALVNVDAKQDCNTQMRVEPGNAAGSYLVNKITASGVCQGEKKMPPSTMLSAANTQKIIDWVCQGAPDN